VIVRRLLAAATAVASATLLTACPSPPPAPSGAPSPSGSSTSTPSPTPSSTALPADLAFAVTGGLISPDGATEVTFRLEVGAPVSGGPDDATRFAASTHCPPDGLNGFASTTFVHVGLETDLVRGDPAGSEVLVSTGLAPSDWQGDYATFQAACADPLVSPIPGTASGLLMVDPSGEVGPVNWIPPTGGYGMSAYVVDPATMDVTAWTVDTCALELGPASTGTAVATLTRVDAAFACAFGLADS
jgi:hypothetical protein